MGRGPEPGLGPVLLGLGLSLGLDVSLGLVVGLGLWFWCQVLPVGLKSMVWKQAARLDPIEYMCTKAETVETTTNIIELKGSMLIDQLTMKLPEATH